MRLIGADREQLGTLPVAEALRAAEDAGMDLVEVSADSDPPVCRIADHGRLLYQASKHHRQARKGRRTGELKEIRLRPNINDNNLTAKTSKIQKFLTPRQEVKLTVRFRGREIVHQTSGVQFLRRIAADLEEDIKLEGPPASQGRSLTLTLIPSRTGSG